MGTKGVRRPSPSASSSSWPSAALGSPPGSRVRRPCLAMVGVEEDLGTQVRFSPGPTGWESNPKRQGGSRRDVPPSHQGIWRPPRAGLVPWSPGAFSPGPTAWESNPKHQGGSRRAVPPAHQGIWPSTTAGRGRLATHLRRSWSKFINYLQDAAGARNQDSLRLVPARAVACRA